MRILVAAKYVDGSIRGGGSSRFMRCVADTLAEMGHEVVASASPPAAGLDFFDLAICSHAQQFKAAQKVSLRTVYISHGTIVDEAFAGRADRNVSISEEVRAANLSLGVDSVVIGQPVRILPQLPVGDELLRILVIRREPVSEEPFSHLAKDYALRYSDRTQPIEEQIAWADLVISLGRGALEAMAQGRPVIVADARPYIGRFGDGYVDARNVLELAKCNFSGRRFKHPVTREWLDAELAKYDPADGGFLYRYVRDNHDAKMICSKYLEAGPVVSFGVLVNDLMRLDMCFRQSEIDGKAHIIKDPTSATSGLNKLLDIMTAEGADVAVLAHQDMHFRQGWLPQVREQLAKLPADWDVAGIIGKDLDGNICGKFHDMRIAPVFNTSDLHEFPQEASCFDECCILVNLKSGFRFDEHLDGFDLYGTLAVLQTWERGKRAFIIDAFAEHYCMRPFSWFPDKDFQARFKWLHERFRSARRIDSTVLGVERQQNQAA